jgi:branched-chain amino acid transport system ATP-binding protein
MIRGLFKLISALAIHSARVQLQADPFMLRLTKVAAGYGLVQVLWDISMEIGDREIVCLIGSNGVGKTTLLRTISGLVSAWSGSIEFNGTDIRALPNYDIVTFGIAHIPEGRHLFPTMTVRDNLLIGAYRQHDSSALRTDLERVYDLFPILAERSSQIASTLSGGEQQMCAIARGLMSRPKLLLIDELSLGLAPRIVDDLAEVLREIRTLGISILLVEQDVSIALDLAERGFLLDTGRIALSASSKELAQHPTVKLAYIGA